MSILFLYFVYSATILGCISASIGHSTQSEICERVNRLSTPQHYGCGECRDGYVENPKGGCVLNCPDEATCKRLRREECTETTRGQCGDCLYNYLQIQGICVTESEVENVIKRIEVMLDDSPHIGTRQGDTVPKNIVTSTAADVVTEAKTEPATENLTTKSTEEVPLAPASQTDQLNNDDGIPTGDKRVPDSGSSPSHSGSAPHTHSVNVANPANIAASQLSHDANGAAIQQESSSTTGLSRLVFFVVVLSISMMCLVSVVIAGVCWYRLNKQRKLMASSDYVGYGTTNGDPGDYIHDKKSGAGVPPRSESGDRKLAHSAQMYHYQHHKQQMMALEKSQSDRVDESDQDDLEENEDGNYTVYECPGLAPAGEMEVSNPLFQQQANNNKGSGVGGGALSPGSTSPLSSNNSQDDPTSHHQQYSPNSATSTTSE